MTLFTWQRAILASSLPTTQRLTALRIGLDSHQSTGREVVINAAEAATDLDCSERTVWRHVADLAAAGWMTQTTKPTYSGPSGKGRRARYRLAVPGESSDSTSVVVSGDPDESSDTLAVGTSHDSVESPATTALAVAHDNPSRLPNQVKSSATATANGGTLSASNGSSNSSSSCIDVEILASKLRLNTPLAGLRTDKLNPDQAARIAACIGRHGDQRLVDQAMRTLRRDLPPQTIQAFLVAWESMPPPGQRLALVPDRACSLPGHQGTVRHCVECSSEAHERGDAR